jgi:integrase
MAAPTSGKRKRMQVEASSTFSQAAKAWLDWSQTRSRKPIRATSVPTIEGALKKWINPHIGDLTLDKVHNGSVKHLVTAMKDANLSAQTITSYTNIIKNVVSSVIDEESGEPIYPRKWRADILDLPIIENQKQPCFTAKEIESLIVDTSQSRGWEQLLYILLAATGLRISEALGLESKHIINKGSTIVVEQQVSRFGAIVPYTKSKAGRREVDIAPEIAALFEFHRHRKGLLFGSRKGTPVLPGNVEKRKLKKHTAKGFHAFRRYRNTWLRSQNCQPDLLLFWMGHSAKNSMTELYSKLAQDVKARLREAERIGLGFRLDVEEIAAERQLEAEQQMVVSEA